jgi:hypothetical protein
MAGAIPITFRRRVGGAGLAAIQRVPEAANCVALDGTPIAVSGGYANAAANFNNNNNQFLGFSTEYGKNRAANGTAEHLTFGYVRNQANAELIPVGAPMDDGNIGVLIPKQGDRFMGALTSANNSAQNMVGTVMGLTKDSNNYWYINPANNNETSGGCIRITELIDAAGTAGGKLEFEVINTRLQLYEQDMA